MNIAIITGASSGMGLEFALQLDNLLSKVDEIWLIARRKEEMLQVASCMEHTTRVLDMDMTNAADMEKLNVLLSTEKPVIRMLVNCAGYGVMGEFETLTCKEQTGMIDLNCKALTEMTYMCLPFMKRNSRIIQLASSAAFLPQANFAIYAATKAYVLSFSRALSEELRTRQIYVTAVCPGPVNTPFFEVAERNGKTLAAKKLFMAEPEAIVQQAIADSYHKKQMSVYGISMKSFRILTRLVPNETIFAIMRYLK